jgi:uncharacterized membrane protein YgcG
MEDRMNDQNGMQPLEPQNQNPMPPAPTGGGQFDYNPSGSYGGPGASQMGTKMSSKLLYGVGLGIMILIVPLGMFKIGSPTPCSGDRLKNKECVVIDNAAGCTPKMFSLESEYLTCKMVGAYASPEFKEIDKKFAEENASKAESCSKLNDEIRKSNGFKCYATEAMFVGKTGKDGKGPDVLAMAPLDVQKLSVLSSVSDSVLTRDMAFTIIIFVILLIIMAAAAYTAHKKNRDGFIHVAGVFIVGIMVAYFYRYYVAGFYQGDIVVLVLSLAGVIPAVVIAMAAAGRIGKLREDAPPLGGGEYRLGAPEVEKPVLMDVLPVSEATRFERMAMEHTNIGRSLFTLGFIAMVLSLIPIGLLGMGKSSNANANMQKEAKVSTMMRKSAEEATTSDSGGDIEEGGGVESPEGEGGAEGGGEGGGEAAPAE